MHVKRMLEVALQDLDEGWSLRCGSGYCGWLYPTPEREPYPQSDQGLSWVEEVLTLARYFALKEVAQNATELMNRYLKDSLCLLPKGHKWYLELAKIYSLEEAREYIEGFYATIYGKVEIEDEKGMREPAPGAVVTITDPHDNTRWVDEADEDGKYEIKKVILHQDCSPFKILVEYEGDSETDEYEGPLDEPDPSYEYQKDLIVKPIPLEGTIKFRWVTHLPEDSPVRKELSSAVFDNLKTWSLEVKMDKESSDPPLRIYKLTSAVFDFQHKYTFEGTKVDVDGYTRLEQERVRSLEKRKLTPKECELRLVVNRDEEAYQMEGLIDIEDVREQGFDSLSVKDASGFIFNKKLPVEDTEDIILRVDFNGRFEKEKWELRGSQEEELPGEAEMPGFFQLGVVGMKVWYDTLKGTIEWDIKKSKKKQ